MLAAASAVGDERVGDIEFFGGGGFDLPRIREALPVHKGDQYSEGMKAAIRERLRAATAKEVTDVATVCCDGKGDRLVYIGLPGLTSQPIALLPQPAGSERLPAEIVNLYRRLDAAIEAAVRKGGKAAEEDDSNGYSLINDPAARGLELQVRRWAIAHESELFRALRFSSAVEHRRVASDAAGYASRSKRQLLALVEASRDPDAEVRNNATRALGVLARAKAELAAQIPAENFIRMLKAPNWSDRNKAASLLMELSKARNPAVLVKIRSEALGALVEMARWRDPGHAFFARVILGRVAGIPENRLSQLAWEGPVEEIVKAAGVE